MTNGDGDNFIDKALIQWIDRLKEGKFPEGFRYWIGGIIILLLAIFGAGGSFYVVGTEETAVVQRLGKYLMTTEAGLHFKMPFGIDKITVVKTGRIFKEEFGFRTLRAGIRSEYSTENFDHESLTLTGDLNVVDVEWIVQFRILDPFKFKFKIEDPLTTIRDTSEAVVRQVIGGTDVTKVLSDRSTLAVMVQKDLQKILDGFDIGVSIGTVDFQDVNPPGPVKDAFNDVNEAEQQQAALIFEAREQYNKEVPKARGVASQTIAAAEGYAMERLNRARGETQRFLDLLTEYKKAPDVTRRRLYLETMEEILPKLKEFYVLDAKEGNTMPILPHLQLRSTNEEVTP